MGWDDNIAIERDLISWANMGKLEQIQRISHAICTGLISGFRVKPTPQPGVGASGALVEKCTSPGRAIGLPPTASDACGECTSGSYLQLCTGEVEMRGNGSEW